MFYGDKESIRPLGEKRRMLTVVYIFVKLGFPVVCGVYRPDCGGPQAKAFGSECSDLSLWALTSMTRWAVSPLSERYRTMSPRFTLPGSTGSTVVTCRSARPYHSCADKGGATGSGEKGKKIGQTTG